MSETKNLNKVHTRVPLVYYQCNFCGEQFLKCSDCAKHIEKKSFLGICFPLDIIVLDSPEVKK